MAQFASATFSGTAFTELNAANGSFSKQSGRTHDLILGSTGAYLISADTGGGAWGAYQHSGSPASADYTVSASIANLATPVSAPFFGVCGRMQAAADTYYMAVYRSGTGVQLYKNVAGTTTQLGSTYTYTLSSSVALLLRMEGDQISVQLGGSTIIGPITDTAITTAGKAGVMGRDMRQTSVADTFSIDNFSADDIGGGGGSTYAPTIRRGGVSGVLLTRF